jgi:DNA-binding IscR family transcriptional regulator
LTRSQLGSGGGALLAKEPDAIRLLDVYRAVEDPELFAVHRQSPCAECPVGANILGAIRPVLTRAQAAMEAELGKTTIAEIARQMTVTAKV